MKPVIIIPAYKPDSALLELVSELQAHDVDMIIVNDGSGDLYLPVFDALVKDYPNLKWLLCGKNSTPSVILKSRNYIQTSNYLLTFFFQWFTNSS